VRMSTRSSKRTRSSTAAAAAAAAAAQPPSAKNGGGYNQNLNGASAKSKRRRTGGSDSSVPTPHPTRSNNDLNVSLFMLHFTFISYLFLYKRNYLEWITPPWG
jgi:hypothetical protein